MKYLIHQLIDTVAEQTPDHEAVRMYSEMLTYGELSRKSNSLARALRSEGVRRGDRVGIFMSKSLESLVAVYGIMKAGAVYVPLDHAAPTSRLVYAITDCGIQHIVTSSSNIDALHQIVGNLQAPVIAFGVKSDRPKQHSLSWEDIFQLSDESLTDVAVIDEDLAYFIYTSGSTGVPKGIMHTHYSGLSFAKWAAATYQITSADRLTNQAPLHFDMSIFDFFAAAAGGATTVIIPDEYMRLPASYSQLLASEKITTIFTVPFALSQLLFRGALEKRDLSALRWIVFGGDTHSPAHIRKLMEMLPDTRFSHMYGPAETNGCTYHNIESLPENPDEPISIGVPCENMEGIVVDEKGDLLGPGDTGELLMRGPTLMQGYWKRPEMNKRVFFRNTIQPDYEAVYYRTGDLVEILPDGQYKFIGRKDRQVKIRGYRVELDEIEMALMAHPAVEEAAAFPVETDNAGKHIEAAVKTKNTDQISAGDLIAYLKENLPWFVVPTQILMVTDFPRTATGKINRRELQAQSAGA